MDQLRNLKSIRSHERSHAILWLTENVDSPTNKKLLRESLQNDPSELVRSTSARLIALDGSSEFVADLEQALADSSPIVRMEAAQGLGSLHSYASIPLLIKLLKDDGDLWVRLKILKTIEYIEAMEAVPTLIEILDDQEPAIRFQTLAILEQFTGEKIGMDKARWKRWYEKQNTNNTG